MSTTLHAEVHPPVRQRAQRGLVAALGFAEFAYATAVSLPLLLGLGLKVEQIAPASKETTLGIVSALGGVAIVLANPISGHLSDRTTSRWGMRRPWILGGAAVGALSLMLLAAAPTVPILAIAWILAVASYNAMLAGLTAVLVDQFPTERRARVVGVFSMCNLLGVVPAMLIAQAIPQPLTVQFAIPGALGVLAALALCVLLPDRRLARADRSPVNLRSLASALLVLPRNAADYRRLWVQRLLVSTGFALIGAYTLYYTQARLGLPTPEAVKIVGLTLIISTLLSGLTAYLGGLWSARIGRGQPFVFWATLMLGGTLLLKAVTANLAVVIAAAALTGIATGVYYAVDLSMVTHTLPDQRDTGRYLGTFAMAKNLPFALAPALAPALLAIGNDPISGGKNYLLLFGTCGVVTLVAAPMVRKLTIR